MTIQFETQPVSKVIGIFAIVLTSLGFILTKFQEPIIYFFFVPLTTVLMLYNHYLVRKLVVSNDENNCSFSYTLFGKNYFRYKGSFTGFYFEIIRGDIDHGDNFLVTIMEGEEAKYSIDTHMDFEEFNLLFRRLKKVCNCTANPFFNDLIERRIKS
jgi:hypothetical protein